jgi:hypothetical protein
VPYFAVAVDPLVAPGGAGASLHVFSYGDVGVVDWEIDGLPPGVTVTPAQGANQAGDVIPIAIDPAGLTADFPLVVFGTSEKTTYNSVWWFTVHPQ